MPRKLSFLKREKNSLFERPRWRKRRRRWLLSSQGLLLKKRRRRRCLIWPLLKQRSETLSSNSVVIPHPPSTRSSKRRRTSGVCSLPFSLSPSSPFPLSFLICSAVELREEMKKWKEQREVENARLNAAIKKSHANKVPLDIFLPSSSSFRFFLPFLSSFRVVFARG